MEIKEFQDISFRTMPKNLWFPDILVNMCMGISGESGEVIDLFKKHLFQGHSLDKKKVAEEIGDLMFYIVNLCTLLDLDMRVVLQGNVDKLKKRYPNGFEVEKSINRGD